MFQVNETVSTKLKEADQYIDGKREELTKGVDTTVKSTDQFLEGKREGLSKAVESTASAIHAAADTASGRAQSLLSS